MEATLYDPFGNVAAVERGVPADVLTEAIVFLIVQATDPDGKDEGCHQPQAGMIEFEPLD